VNIEEKVWSLIKKKIPTSKDWQGD